MLRGDPGAGRVAIIELHCRGICVMCKRIQRKRAKGWRIPENTVSVTRYRKDNPGKWGNPFVVGEHGTAQQCVDKFRAWITTQDKDFSELKGKNIACWCKPGAPCHGDVLLELANREVAA